MIYYYYHYAYYYDIYIYILLILVGEVYTPTWSTYNSEAPSGKTQGWVTLLLRTCETGGGSFRGLKARLHVRSHFWRQEGTTSHLLEFRSALCPGRPHPMCCLSCSHLGIARHLRHCHGNLRVRCPLHGQKKTPQPPAPRGEGWVIIA